MLLRESEDVQKGLAATLRCLLLLFSSLNLVIFVSTSIQKVTLAIATNPVI